MDIDHRVKTICFINLCVAHWACFFLAIVFLRDLFSFERDLFLDQRIFLLCLYSSLKFLKVFALTIKSLFENIWKKSNLSAAFLMIPG